MIKWKKVGGSTGVIGDPVWQTTAAGVVYSICWNYVDPWPRLGYFVIRGADSFFNPVQTLREAKALVERDVDPLLVAIYQKVHP